LNTKDFIKRYCKATTESVHENSLNEMMSHIVDYETIREYLIAIPYEKYLQTLYWKSISKFVRSKYTSCKCGSKENLHVHHNTYIYVGIEHLHINCLEVVCDKCHSLIHSCEGAPKSKDRGLGYEDKKDKLLKKYNSIRVNRRKQKPSGKSQNQLFIELCRATGELETLRSFKKRKYNKEQKGAIIATLLEKLKTK